MSYMKGLAMTTIVAYTYKAEVLCPSCTMDALHVQQSVRDESSPEAILDMLADLMALDRQDERTFDSSDFPKVVFADQIVGRIAECESGDDLLWSAPECCDSCGEELL